MSFDPRSLERLRELGRNLPQPLPKPEAPPAPPKASEQRHKVETETNPEALFRELMQASPDGTVPPHLMARLKELEGSRSPRRRPGAPSSAMAIDAANAGIELGRDEPPAPPPQPAAVRGRTTAPRPGRARSSEEESLYTAFQQLLLEDDDA
jgi:hypothetical protein